MNIDSYYTIHWDGKWDTIDKYKWQLYEDADYYWSDQSMRVKDHIKAWYKDYEDSEPMIIGWAGKHGSTINELPDDYHKGDIDMLLGLGK